MYAGPADLNDEFSPLDYDISDFMEELLKHNCAPFWQEYEQGTYYSFS